MTENELLDAAMRGRVLYGPVVVDPEVPRGEVHFVMDGRVVGKIVNVS